jgi:hypothetical protein
MGSGIKSGKTYWMIKTCPDGTTCILPPLRNISNATPVTSLVTNETYITIKCAFCNNEQLSDLVLWEKKKVCISRSALLARENLDGLFDSVFKQYPVCNIGFIPPASIENVLKACLVYTHDVNCEGRTKAHLINACRQYNLPYYAYDAVYKNIYCAMCDIDVKHLYIQNENDLWIFNPLLTSFSAVLDFKIDEKKSISKMTCAADQTFDELLVSCIVSVSNVPSRNAVQLRLSIEN